jgi:hypothetical protein
MIVIPRQRSKEVVAILQELVGREPVLHDSGLVSFLSLSLLNFWHPTMSEAIFIGFAGRSAKLNFLPESTHSSKTCAMTMHCFPSSLCSTAASATRVQSCCFEYQTQFNIFARHVSLHARHKIADISRKVLEKRYPTLNLEYVRPSQEWLFNSYSGLIRDTSSFGAMIRSNIAYKGLRHPMKAVEGQFRPDFDHRYLAEGYTSSIAAAHR